VRLKQVGGKRKDARFRGVDSGIAGPASRPGSLWARPDSQGFPGMPGLFSGPDTPGKPPKECF